MVSHFKGKYSLRFPKKYRGNPTQCIFRSSWELQVMKWMDTNSKVKWWSSEPFPIPYISPIDGKKHNYWPDFIFCIDNKEGKEQRILVEVKPLAQTKAPPKQKRRTRAYINRVQTWGKNQAKWKAAKILCENQNWQFSIWTEKTKIPNMQPFT